MTIFHDRTKWKVVWTWPLSEIRVWANPYWSTGWGGWGHRQKVGPLWVSMRRHGSPACLEAQGRGSHEAFLRGVTILSSFIQSSLLVLIILSLGNPCLYSVLLTIRLPFFHGSIMPLDLSWTFAISTRRHVGREFSKSSTSFIFWLFRVSFVNRKHEVSLSQPVCLSDTCDHIVRHVLSWHFEA